MSTSNNIRRMRKTAGLSQADLADRLGVHQTVVSRWERGVADLPDDRVGDLAEALNVPPQDLKRLGVPEPDSSSGYVNSEAERSSWRDAVYESDLSGEAKLILTALAVPQLLNKNLWIVTTTVDEFLEVVKLNPELVRAHWDEAISSPFVERVGSVEWVLRLKFPE